MSKLNHKLKEKFVGANCVRPHFGGIAKNENGITLIALIITIIVMLVLTGVTLAVTLGENGLIAKANEAKIQMQIETDREELLSAVVGAIGIDGKVDFTYLDSHLPSGFTGSNGTYTSANGHEFTVSINGEIVYTGAGTPGDDVIENGGEIETGTVDLNGRYYNNSTEWYIDIINHDTWLEGTEEEHDRAILEMTINEDTKSGTMVTNYIIDENTMETEPYKFYFTYELEIENGEVVNKILYLTGEESESTIVFWQNTKGFEYNLNGNYFNEGNQRLVFDSENGICDLQYYDSENNWVNRSHNYDMLYFSYNDVYVLNGEIITISDDLNTIEFYGITYTKQTNTEPEEPEIIPYETTVEFSYDGTEENMETWYVVSVDETARTMDIALPRGMDAFTVGKSDPVAIENATDLDGDNVVEDFEIAIYSWNHMGDSIETFFNNFSANFPSNVVGYTRNCSYSYSGDYLIEEYGVLELTFNNSVWNYNYKPYLITGIDMWVYYPYTDYDYWNSGFGIQYWHLSDTENTVGGNEAIVYFNDDGTYRTADVEFRFFPTVTIKY